MAATKKNTKERNLKRNPQKDCIDWITSIVVKISEKSVSIIERKKYQSAHKAKSRASAQPTSIWISRMLSKLVVSPAVDMAIQKKFKTSQLKKAFAKYQQVSFDVNVFIQKSSSDAVPEKIKKLPGKIQKMRGLLEDEMLQLQKIQPLSVDSIITKYEVLETKITLAVKQLQEYLSGYGVTLDNFKQVSNKRTSILTELQPISKRVKRDEKKPHETKTKM